MSDPDVDFWEQVLPAHEALVAGRTEDALARYLPLLRSRTQNATEGRVGYILAAHLARDLEAARTGLAAMAEEPYAGNFVDGINRLGEAGVAALEGRHDESLTAFRDAIDKWRANGARFFVALAQLDALALLPDERSIDGWVDEARERFEIVGSQPLLERLDEVAASRRAGSVTSDLPGSAKVTRPDQAAPA